ncbi:hypothetical protein MAC_08266 [Metarhizium acridum CQMa 102]|uniref:PHD finger domain protein n=1 Tax=Metarhizium acridum (strain CQMa 102) TaxID=655827 RepID=E9EEG8_METAQ|nr:uncharacterized protein MAC_08266 [Metarhizium acridum CQMa 102]EFY85675.1 hypothetical protein MAC_08266 [Metarhizium acridum CQMa 102]
MSEDHPAASSFGEPNAQPPTPKQTPTSAVFPSPVFETPKHYQGSFVEAGGLTPRFAEEYSVFNATPGNLRGTQSPFPDFVPIAPVSSSASHKRLLSAEGLAIDITAHTNHFSPNPSAALPPVAPAHRLSSSPNPPTADTASLTAGLQSQLNHKLSKTPTSSPKKARRCTIAEEPTQVISPPPTARKRERWLSPRFNMQNDQSFGRSDFHDLSQQEMVALMSSATDIFGYPMSAPAATHSNFWDPTMSMNMDLDVTTAGTNMFQPPTPSSHRQTGSFDWNSEIQLFQDPNAPPSSNQENVQPTREERPLAPKPTASDIVCTGAHEPSLLASFAPMLEDPFDMTSMISAGDAVDPGLLFSRPQSAPIAASFESTVQSGTAEAAIQLRKTPFGEGCRSGSVRDRKNTTKGPERATACSLVNSLGRPGLGRSISENNRGRKTVRRGSLPMLAPAARAAPDSGLRGSKSTGRLPGRISPLKTQQRLSSLASIPEMSPQARQHRSVRLSINAHGRATVETSLGRGGTAMIRSQSSQDLSTHRSWSSAEDDSDTDDEPIIIPSRNNSFKASFALPDPREPVGSIFSSRRSASDRSNSNSPNEGDSEAETVVNEKPGKYGDAASELRKVVEDRQKHSLRLGSAISSQRSLNTNIRIFPGGIISPTSLTESSYGPDSYNVRCVCNNSKADESDGFLVQWYVSSSPAGLTFQSGSLTSSPY